ncbi:UNVERIFIED_CONTAM: hypothetical protein K2H54_053339 [Gekko kuhli]
MQQNCEILALTTSPMINGAEGEDTATIPVTTSDLPVTEAPVTTGAPITTAPVTAAPITYAPFLLGPGFPGFYTPSGLAQQGLKAFQARMVLTLYPTFLAYQMASGQLTQWSQIHPDLTAEMYLPTEGPWRESRWDLQGQGLYQLVLEEGAGETSSVWLEPWPRRSRTPHEEQLELENDDLEEDVDPWGTHLENLEKGQQTIQGNLEEVMLTIPEIVIQAI